MTQAIRACVIFFAPMEIQKDKSLKKKQKFFYILHGTQTVRRI